MYNNIKIGVGTNSHFFGHILEIKWPPVSSIQYDLRTNNQERKHFFSFFANCTLENDLSPRTVYCTVESDIPCSLHNGNAFLLYFSPFLLN